MEESSSRNGRSRPLVLTGNDYTRSTIFDTPITIESLLDFIHEMEAFEELLLKHVKKLENVIDNELHEKASLVAENKRLHSELTQLRERKSSNETKDTSTNSNMDTCQRDAVLSPKEFKPTKIELDASTGVKTLMHSNNAVPVGSDLKAAETVNEKNVEDSMSSDKDMRLGHCNIIILDDDLSEDDSVITTEYSYDDSDSWDDDDDDYCDDDDKDEKRMCCYIPEQLKSPSHSHPPLFRRSTSHRKDLMSNTAFGRTHDKHQLPSIPSLTPPLSMPLPFGFSLQSENKIPGSNHAVAVPPSSRPTRSYATRDKDCDYSSRVSSERHGTSPQKATATTTTTMYNKQLLADRRLQVESGQISPPRKPKATVLL